MIQPLPTGGFKLDDVSKFRSDNISRLANDSKGYLLEVDIRYPKELHDSNNDLLVFLKDGD